MKEHQANANVVYQEMKREDALIKEFARLRPSKWRWLSYLLSSMALLGFIYWQYPQASEQPIIYILLILALSTGGSMIIECQRVDKRIDLLYKILKQPK
ncbi:hypothetical protein [Pseudoalteromonas pernae]|uniref:hypothetical protein n=1 Tax=Pseudoalteromonas pernae TaxID=3118054 RepID=UPI003241DA68